MDADNHCSRFDRFFNLMLEQISFAVLKFFIHAWSFLPLHHDGWHPASCASDGRMVSKTKGKAMKTSKSAKSTFAKSLRKKRTNPSTSKNSRLIALWSEWFWFSSQLRWRSDKSHVYAKNRMIFAINRKSSWFSIWVMFFPNLLRLDIIKKVNTGLYWVKSPNFLKCSEKITKKA